MQPGNSPEIHPGNGSHGKAPDGQGKGCDGMGTVKNGSFVTADHDGDETKEGKKMLSGWQVDDMWATESSRMWEELNAPDPNEGRYEEARHSIDVALQHLNKAVDWMRQAADEVEGLPLENKILSLAETMENAGFDTKIIRGEQ